MTNPPNNTVKHEASGPSALSLPVRSSGETPRAWKVLSVLLSVVSGLVALLAGVAGPSPAYGQSSPVSGDAPEVVAAVAAIAVGVSR